MPNTITAKRICLDLGVQRDGSTPFVTVDRYIFRALGRSIRIMMRSPLAMITGCVAVGAEPGGTPPRRRFHLVRVGQLR